MRTLPDLHHISMHFLLNSEMPCSLQNREHAFFFKSSFVEKQPINLHLKCSILEKTVKNHLSSIGRLLSKADNLLESSGKHKA